MVCTAERRVFVVRPSSRKLGEQICHFDRAKRGLVALVSGLCPSAVHRMLQGVGGDDAEDDRYTCFETSAGDAGGGLPGNVVEMAGGTADHCAETDHGCVSAASSEALGDRRDLERAG